MSAQARPAYFRLRKPCKNCPFRNDTARPFYLGRPRRLEIAGALRAGSTFTCHETTVPVEDDDSGTLDMTDGPKAAMCAGALATMERERISSQAVRMALGFGMTTTEHLDHLRDTAPVHDSLTEWVAAEDEPSDVELEHCGVVGSDCEDPAGYASSSGVHENDDEPTCDTECAYCGHAMCSACTSAVNVDGPCCVTCAEEDAEQGRDDSEW
jgi:hypothetical protein